MLNLKLVLLFSGVWLMLITALITPNPIAYNTVQITWVTQPETAALNVWDVDSQALLFAGDVTGGITNTLTLVAGEGAVIQVQEYKLVNGNRLERIMFFNTNPVPASDFPTPTQTVPPTQTQQPTNTPLPTLTITPIQLTHQFYTPIVIH